jgi:hypothetical protein
LRSKAQIFGPEPVSKTNFMLKKIHMTTITKKYTNPNITTENQSFDMVACASSILWAIRNSDFKPTSYLEMLNYKNYGPHRMFMKILHRKNGRNTIHNACLFIFNEHFLKGTSFESLAGFDFCKFQEQVLTYEVIIERDTSENMVINILDFMPAKKRGYQ